MTTTISVGNGTVGLVVRGKKNDAHKPGVLEQHADCVLPGGAPIGFYGGGGDASSGSSGSSATPNGPSGSSNSSGFNMKGLVADYATMKRIRPQYVDLAYAKRYNSVSTILLLDVGLTKASLFKKFWQNLKLNPGAFNILGANCSTHASEAFVHANILSRGIPGLDTPDNLYRQLKSRVLGSKSTYNGFVGFIAKSGGNYDLVIE